MKFLKIVIAYSKKIIKKKLTQINLICIEKYTSIKTIKARILLLS